MLKPVVFQVQLEFEKWRRRKSLLNNQYSTAQSPDDNGSPGGEVPVRSRPILDSLCCCLNILFHPQPEKNVPMSDAVRHQAEIRMREDVMTYGMGTVGMTTGVVRTMPRGFNGMPVGAGDPRLMTAGHGGRSQYYMNTLERNAQPQQYYQDADHLEDEDHRQVHMMNYMNDLDAAMTRPIAYPQYDGDEEVSPTAGSGYYPQQAHLMAMGMNAEAGMPGDMLVDQDPYNHMQNFEQHVMHRKESHDRRVEDELWQGSNQFVGQTAAAGPEFRRGGDTMQSMGTHGRTRGRKKNNSNNVGGGGGHYQMGGGGGSQMGSSYNVHGGDGGEFVLEGRHLHHNRGDEPIYEEILSNMSGASGRQGGSRHLSAFLNEKSNSVVSCLEPIK